MNEYGPRSERLKGASKRAPFVLVLTSLIVLISLGAMVRGWWLNQQLPAPTPSKEQPKEASQLLIDSPFELDIVIDLTQDHNVQKEAGKVAGQVFSILHQQMKSNEERLKKLSEWVTTPVYQSMNGNLDLPLEPVSWKRIKVVSVRPLDTDHWSFLVAGVLRGEKVEDIVQVQVRKVEGIWKAVSIDESP
ncbi:hypothetical protein [Thermoactinomyces sp. DSM 45892]|uniref:hypothetical protein n=1 Tax=Thermoactinomyces sp. DSM 45892 TaxID=1882753 RepID=UPI00089D2CC8|nr:hypothetical protein [Thermoactinomyces sp. DSM 45892]SDY77151.1 hypothetical protein SAMN05444416_10851 [Thermoactinomyces sp. DSM 45892]